MAKRKLTPQKDGIRRRPILVFALALSAVLAGVGLLWWHDFNRTPAPRQVEIALQNSSSEALANTAVLGPIDTANVPISQWGGYTGQTDDAGLLVAGRLLPGEYWLRTAGGAYLLNLPKNAPDTVRMTLREDESATAVTLRVQNERGEPAAEQTIHILPNGMLDQPFLQTPPVNGVTDWQGQFVWRDAPVGAHLVKIETADYPLLLEPSEIKAVQQTFVLAPRSEMRYERSLQILQKNGRPFENGALDLVEYSLPSGKECLIKSMTSDENGVCVLFGLSPGTHTLRIQGRRYKFTIPYIGAPQQDKAVIRLY